MSARQASGQAILKVDTLPGGEVDAAAEFYKGWLGQAMHLLDGQCTSLLLVLPDAPASHRDWRLAAVRGLARNAAPCRVNMISGADSAAAAATARYLENAAGITGHYLALDGSGAGNPAA